MSKKVVRIRRELCARRQTKVSVKRRWQSMMGKPRSRDVKDDPYLACALGAGAKLIVTRDGDLLVLGQPFGIQIITPRELLARLSRPL